MAVVSVVEFADGPVYRGRSGQLSNTSLTRFETQMRVLISGAGPAGLTAAYWLRRFGYSPSIVERAPSLLIGSYKIDVRGAALQVLRLMGFTTPLLWRIPICRALSSSIKKAMSSIG
jgi:NADPH-dependent 2,4-dienoyl-CoA reductase/sulfur reductase-like enzyme